MGVKEACAAAVEFEAKNVALYDRLLATGTTAGGPSSAGQLPEDVKRAFEHNRMASLDHHKPAVERCAGVASARGPGRGVGRGRGHCPAAEAGGVSCMAGCMLESRLGITAAAHLALATEAVVFCDLDSFWEHAEDPIAGGAEIRDGMVTIGEEPGLGAAPGAGRRACSTGGKRPTRTPASRMPARLQTRRKRN